MPEISGEQLDRLGQLADKADNYLYATMLPISAATHIEGLTHGMRELKCEITALYRELGGTEL